MPLADLIDAHGAAAMALSFAVMFCAGLSKGVVGFSLPTIAVSGIGSFMPASLAIAAIIAPSIVTNTWQTFRQGFGAAWSSLRAYWRMNAALFVMIALCAQLVTLLTDRQLYGVLGSIVTLFGLIQIVGWKPPKPRPEKTALVQTGAGTVAGVFGGLSGVWGPPIMMYLIAIDTPKQEQVRVQGISFLIGSFILLGAHLRSGLMLGDGGMFSLAMVVPACLGMALGLAVQDRLDQNVFRKATLVVLIFAGLNLLRRAATG